jgi:hypothetical protein
VCRASAPVGVPAGREGHEKGFAGSRTTSLEDISLKSLAPSSRDPDSAALRAQLHSGQKNGASLIVTPRWEGGQGAGHGPCSVASQFQWPLRNMPLVRLAAAQGPQEWLIPVTAVALREDELGALHDPCHVYQPPVASQKDAVYRACSNVHRLEEQKSGQ